MGESAQYGGPLCEVDCGHGAFLAGSTCECEPGFAPAAWSPTTREPMCSRHAACTAAQLQRAEEGGEAAACGGAHFPSSRLLTRA